MSRSVAAIWEVAVTVSQLAVAIFAVAAFAATCKSIRIAEAALALAQEQFQLVDRPWMGQATGLTVKWDEAHKEFRGEIGFRNSGHSPAFAYSGQEAALIVDSMVTRDAARENAYAHKAASEWEPPIAMGVVAPGETANFVFYSQAVTRDEVERISSRSARIYFIGRVLYTDNKDRNHETSFCMWATGLGKDADSAYCTTDEKMY